MQTGPLTHDLLVGFEHSDEERRPILYSQRNYITIDPYNPSWPADRGTRPAASINRLHEARSQGIYVQDLVSFTEQWKVLLGLRQDHYRFRSTDYLKGESRSYKGHSLSQRAGVIYQPVPEHSLYASWSKSFAPFGGRGMISIETASSAVHDADPQYSRQMEVGVKSDWANNAFSTQFAVYQLEHYNIRYQPDADNDPYTWAVRGKERSRGVEFTLTGRLVDNWYVRGGVGLTQAKVVSDAAQPELTGKKLRNVARRNGNLFVRYAPEGAWYGEVGVTHASPRWLNAANTQELPGYTRWDAMVGWRQAPWTVHQPDRPHLLARLEHAGHAAHGTDDGELSVLSPVQSNGAGRPRIGRLHRGWVAGYTMRDLCLRKAAMPDARQAPSGAVRPHSPCKPPSSRPRQPFPAPPAAPRCGRCGWAGSMTPRSCWTYALPVMASGSTGARTCCSRPMAC